MNIPPHLSPRQREVLDCISEGMSIAAVAKHLHIAQQTVKHNLSAIYDAVEAFRGPNVNPRVRVAIWWREVGKAAYAKKVEEQSETVTVAPIDWAPEHIRCLRSCGYVQTQKLFADGAGFTDEILRKGESGRTKPWLRNTARLDVLARAIGWTPDKCRMLCRRRAA